MSVIKKLSLVLFASVLAFALLGFRPATVLAQDSMPVACDSTLAVLLLVAEHDYDYLSHMETMPNVDLGQYSGLITSIISMMQSMDMTDEEMATMEAMQARVDELTAMGSTDMLHEWDMMGMSDSGSMDMPTMLPPGDVAGEDELCTSLRADVETFLTAHVIADMESADSMGGM